MRKIIIGSVVLSLVLAAASLAADWPQFRGINHDGISPEKGFVWPTGELKVVWRIPMGAGYSGIVVVKDKAYCCAMRKDQEVAFCLDAATGKELWAASVGRTFNDDPNVYGPRATPAIDGDRLYFYGTYQKLTCLSTTDGKIIWTHDIANEFGGHAPGLGNAASALVDGKFVFVCGGGAGQSFLAFNKITGELAWKGQDDKASHSTPTPATFGGVRQILFLTESGLVGLEAQTGNVLWRYKFPYNLDVAASPVVGGDMVYCAASYQIGSGVAKISKTNTGFTATEVWRTKAKYENQFSTAVYHDGYIYGIFKDPAVYRCIEMATGKEMWAVKHFGAGDAKEGHFGWGDPTVLVDGRLLIQDEKGALVLVEATPTAYHELGHWSVMDARSWTMPAISGGRIYTRNIKEAVCLDVSGK